MTIIAITVIFTLVLAAEGASFFDVVKEEWELYKLEYGKSYSSEVEEKFRMEIYIDNWNKIVEHNLMYEKGLVSFKLGMNQFGDMMHHEFLSTMIGFNEPKNNWKNGSEIMGSYYVEPANVQLPKSVDWRKNGAVTRVKNQGFYCGSCWAFSTTGALEGQHFRKTGKLVSLSEQNLIDCSKNYGNEGCKGGLVANSFRYVKENGGIDTEASYPYKAKDSDSCHYDPKSSGATDTGFVTLPTGNEKKLMSAVAFVGPVAISIDARQPSFRFYRKGVIYEPRCSSTYHNHALLVVGYGTENGKDYWLVKNSWGTTWGNEGYIKMIRNKNNNCGVATNARYPLV